MNKPVDAKHKQEKDETLSEVIISNLLSLLKIFFICFVVAYIAVNYFVRPIRVSGLSMFPTVNAGEFAISNAFGGKFQKVDRGDIVIAYENKYLKKMIVKRVVGLPGETVSCKNDVIYINGEPLYESYLENDWAQSIRETMNYFTDDFDEVTLKEDEYWLLGDNRVHSKDSRELGVFNRKQIRAKDIFVLFPIKNARMLD